MQRDSFSMIKLISSSATDVEQKRTNNEDAFLDLPESGIFAIADGMGGRQRRGGQQNFH